MEFKIEKEDLVRGLYRTQNVVEKKVTMPILLNVLIEAQGTGISLTATDLEIGVKGYHKANVIKEGKATLAAKKLYEIVKELPEKIISLRLKENHWVEISSGKSVFTMMGISAETFPSLPTYDDGEFCSLEVKILKEMIGKTIFAVSTDESRYNLTGVYLVKKEGEENSLRMVATDGYRLSMIDRAFKDQVNGLETGILLPKKGLGEFSKLLDEAGETVSIKIKGSNFIVRKDEVVMVMRLLDAEFPDYKQVIPSRTKKHIRMQRKQTLESLHRVSLLSNEKTRGVKFHFSQDLLEFSTYNPELGEAKEEIPVEYKGEDLVIGFNSRFVLEVLDILGGDEVILELEDGISPGIIRPATDESHTCVIMPMRV